MAAPSTTTWGSIVGGSSAYPTSYGRIGIYTSVSSTDTQTTVTIQTWFWSKYGVDDSYNSYYYNNLASAGSATSLIFSNKNIKTTVSTGSGWSTSNQVKIGESTVTYNRGTSASTRYLYAKLVGMDAMGGTMYASKTVTIPKLASYTIKYNANGGSGAPGNQTKYYGKNLTISSTKPTRTGYSFQGWSLTQNGSVYYTPGSTCGKNENLTLYAVWKANTYTVKYNANGGSGAPGDQTKTYGVTLKLSTTKPTRTNYNFLGWATSASATTVTYAAGGNYTANSGTTLYAVWELAYKKPRITGLTAYRPNDTTGSVKFSWACDKTVSSILIELKSPTGSVISKTLTPTTLNGSVDEVINTSLSTEYTYSVTVTVTDANGYSKANTSLTGLNFSIDVLAGGKGVSFGKPAELEDTADFNYYIYPRKGFKNAILESDSDLNNIITPNIYVSIGGSTAGSYINCPISSGTFCLEVTGAGVSGQIKQVLTYIHKTTSIMYMRHLYGDEWGDWYEAGGLKSAITVALSSSSTLGAVNTYTQIPFNISSFSVRDGLKLSDNYVVVGEGVHNIRISGQTQINCGTKAGNRHGRICRDRNGTISYISWTNVKMLASDQDVLVFTPALCSVEPGDRLFMTFYTPDSKDANYSGSSSNGYQTYMTVESL